MYRTFITLLMLLIIQFSCSKKTETLIKSIPQTPKAGEEVLIQFFPNESSGLQANNDSTWLVGQLVGNLKTKTIYLPMNKKKDYWETKIPTQVDDCLLSFKVENRLGQVEDNDGMGWNIMLSDKNNLIKRNANYFYGQKILRNHRLAAIEKNKQALYYFKNELALFPDNYRAWYDIWFTRLKLSDKQPSAIDQVNNELDSLLGHDPANVDLLVLAFDSNLKLLNNPLKAISFGKTIKQKHPFFPEKDRIDFTLIFLNNQQDIQKLTDDLALFVQNVKSLDYQKIAYLQMGHIYRQQKKLDSAIKNFLQYIDLEPDDVDIHLTLANLFLESGDLTSSQKMLNRAKNDNREKNYIMQNPWEHPSDRKGRLNLTTCQILSIQSAIDFESKNYPAAIESRKKCIELGTPFPAFEWEKIGDIFYVTNDIENSKQAYIKSLCVNRPGNQAFEKMKNIYQSQNGTSDGFEEYLEQSIKNEIKASAQIAPDVEMISLDGEKVKLSENRGRIIVITFWDSWSTACVNEIPQLNLLINDFRNFNDQIIFWAVSVEAPISIKKFLKKQSFDFKHFHSGFAAKQEFSVIGFPTHFIIDKTGKIRYKHIGYSATIRDELKTEIQSILQEQIIS